MMGPSSGPLYIGHGEIRHARLAVRTHAFCIKAFFIRINLKRLTELKSSIWFGIGKFGIFSFNPANYGDGQGTINNPCPWLNSLLNEHNIKEPLGDVWLHTFPKILGYVFNPVSFWFCHAIDGRLLAIVCEVNNTFGEKHCYLLSHSNRHLQAGETLYANKEFHVSPFFDVSGEYEFRFFTNTKKTVARVVLKHEDKPKILTSICGQFEQISTKTWRNTLLRYRWFTLGVILKIHAHAVRLWIKKVPFFKKPTPPKHFTTSSHQSML